ncbi:MAG: EAL domain-containing protein [Clostridiales bacterium]|nr:EAL domain-containing protein [Clostridiales bacterium]
MKDMSMTLITRFNRLIIYILFVLLIGILYHGLVRSVTQTSIVISQWFVYTMIVAFSLVLIKDFFDDRSFYIEKKVLDLNSRDKLVDELGYQDNFNDANQDIVTALFQESFISMMIWNEEGRVVKCNDAFLKKFSYDERVEGMLLYDFISSFVDKSTFDQLIKCLLKSNQPIEKELLSRTKDNEALNIVWKHLKISDTNDGKTQFLSMGYDLTEEKNRVRQIDEMTSKDMPTNLQNRFMFEKKVKELVDEKRAFTIYLMGIDGFKTINELYGYHYGDCYLKDISESFLGMKHLMCYRGSSDKFIFVEETLDDQKIDLSVSTIKQIVRKKISLNDIDCRPTCSIGIVKCNNDKDLSQIEQDIDIALDVAKFKGKNQSVYFKEDYKNEIMKTRCIEFGIDRALEREEFILNFQPIFSISDRSYKKYEVLLRWPNNPVEGSHIGQVIDVAERTGQIIALDRYVISKTFEMLYETKFDGILTVNLSTQSFHSENLFSYLEEMIKRYHVNPSLVQFEITEYSVVKNMEKTRFYMNQMKSLGFKISLDDFGTDYSSLNYLSKLPFDSLKIDKSYIDHISTSKADFAIVKCLVNLAYELGLETIAEGIEHEEQLLILDNLGCHSGQGYLISKPLPQKILLNTMTPGS